MRDEMSGMSKFNFTAKILLGGTGNHIDEESAILTNLDPKPF